MEKPLVELNDHAGLVRALTFSQNAGTLYSSGEDMFINLTDVATLQRKQSIAGGHTAPVTSITVSQSAKAFVSASLDGQVKVWDLVSGKCTQSIAQKAPVWSVAFAPKGEHLVIACQDGTISLIAL